MVSLAARSIEGDAPRKVPTQSPVQSRSMGWPSLQLEMSMKLSSFCWSGEN